MDKEDRIEMLLEKSCFVIDFLPCRVESNQADYFFKVEQYFLKRQQLNRIADSFVRIVLKALCYFEFSIYVDGELNTSDCDTITKTIVKVVTKKKGYIHILLIKEDTLLEIQAGDLHISVFNVSDNTVEILQTLAGSEGLFWRKSD